MHKPKAPVKEFQQPLELYPSSAQLKEIQKVKVHLEQLMRLILPIISHEANWQSGFSALPRLLVYTNKCGSPYFVVWILSNSILLLLRGRRA